MYVGVGRDARRDLARDRADLPLERADARLARVLADHAPQRIVVDDQLLGLEPVLVALPGDEVHPRDVDLLFLGVAAQSEMSSMRSSSAGWIVPSWFAVAMKSTCERSSGISR